ncbi:MAG: hypothetical protein KDD67_13820 [Ignavibacteriae bacterium]|nr:hypothetical protein [Ignavibacteriota bacterium]MCB9216135.1 hypothetical protein [Ignavibacteria bacterium]
MPFITLQELEDHVGKDDVRMVTDEPGAFAAAERGAATVIEAITGISIPANPADAPEWTKQPACWLTYDALFSRASNISQEKLQLWARRAKEARDTLTLYAAKRTGVDETGGSSAVGKIENMPTW